MVVEVLHARENTVAVLDPRLGPLGRLWVDQDQMEDTQGLRRALLFPTAHPLSVCLLYQQERCTAGGRCNQAHIQRHYMYDLLCGLSEVQDRVCCYHHGDPISHYRHDKWNDLQGRMILVTIAAPRRQRAVVVPADRVGLTRYWQNESNDGTIVIIGANKICQLHAKGRCGWGAECRHVHVCREFLSTPNGKRLLCGVRSRKNKPMEEVDKEEASPSSGEEEASPSSGDDDLTTMVPPGSRLNTYRRGSVDKCAM